MKLTMTQEKQIDEQLLGPMVLHRRAESEGGEHKTVVIDGEIKWKKSGLGKASSTTDMRRRGLGAAKTVL
jgi:hypothetical protein